MKLGTKQAERIEASGQGSALASAVFAGRLSLSAWYAKRNPCQSNEARKRSFQFDLHTYKTAQAAVIDAVNSGSEVLIDAALLTLSRTVIAGYYKVACVTVGRAAGSMSAIRGRHAPVVASRGIIGETETYRRARHNFMLAIGYMSRATDYRRADGSTDTTFNEACHTAGQINEGYQRNKTRA
jgi:hypothetical protein